MKLPVAFLPGLPDGRRDTGNSPLRFSIAGAGFWPRSMVVEEPPKRRQLNLQLRAEFFNIFNHPFFALPNGSITFGTDPIDTISQTPDVAQGNQALEAAVRD
jgi:hypothetical protein